LSLLIVFASCSHVSTEPQTDTQHTTHPANIDTIVLLVLLDKVVYNLLIKVLATKMRVSSRSQYFENAILDTDD
jgi:hypothetical protein